MQLPLQISFRHMKPSTEIEGIIRDKATKLDQFADHIMSCRVVVEPAAGRHHQGNPYDVRIALSVPGEEIAVTREPGQNKECQDMHLAARGAFDAARRKLEDYIRRRRGFVKSLEAPPHGRVSKLFPDAEYGFIETPDGREIYFHSNSVLNQSFGQLGIGTEVAFTEEEGTNGPQASSVRLVGRHGHA